ncbi:MAG: histidinol-phosphate transaminase [Melioribacteraceae bacterium]|nr:histidinol-phosphate transaminase [Melioribacteraceae bacterium]
MINIESLLRENIKTLKPYSSARDEYTGSIGIFLDANENSFGSIPEGDLNRYPDPHHSRIKKKLSIIKKTVPNSIFIGNGSDEAIDLLLRTFCEPGKDSVLIMPPTYGMYKVAADINDVNVIEIPLTREFQIAADEVINNITTNTKLIFICSPNNPSGNLLSRDSIRRIIKSFSGIVVIDEAYIDFADEESWISELGSFNNLVVLQTFSKAWGLANIRVGMAYASEVIISVLNKIKYPYNVNGVSQQIIIDTLDNESKKNEVVAKIVFERNKLAKALSGLDDIEYLFPSDSNFILAKVRDANNIYNYLLENKIIVRNRSSMINCEECLRFTVGTELENDKLIEMLQKYGGKNEKGFIY